VPSRPPTAGPGRARRSWPARPVWILRG